ncbi:MAG: ABC transporter permease, partial [Pseudomonadota bacterium]|nr:ABC transporter permease [Pseudomonadota bacterium]
MNIRLALRLLWRDWRAGELTLLLAALVIAVGTVTTITLFVDRLQQALLLESSSFLAADKVISTDQPLPSVIPEKARELGLQHAETIQFVSMVFTGERAQFTAVKAVDDNYPLRGTLITSLTPFTGGAVATGGPDRGTVWMDSRLFPA